MDVEFAFVCDSANLTGDGKLNVLGMFGAVNPPSFPFPLPTMTLIASFEAPWAENELTKKVTIQLMDQDGKKFINLNGDVKIQGKIPGYPIKVISLFVVNNFSFQAPGNYTFNILVDGDCKKQVPLAVGQRAR